MGGGGLTLSGSYRVGFAAEGKINRRDFNVNFSATLDNGGMIVSDEIIIKIDTEYITANTGPR
ncbi:hypothetical protein AYO43_09900 [Nitrospira sp. SCGC AG-212-E16]|nr:hypothetical protein AYO43_09900 [Nitrospira sp. SCGC AG-212-E16]